MAQQNQFSSQDKKVYSIPINSLAAGTTAIGPALPATGGIGTGLINSAAAAYKVIGFMFISTAAATVQLTDSTLGVPLFGPLPLAANVPLTWVTDAVIAIGSTGAGSVLSLVSTGGNINGFVLYYLDPQAEL